MKNVLFFNTQSMSKIVNSIAIARNIHLFLFALLLLCNTTNAQYVKFYQHEDFNGYVDQITGTGLINIQGNSNYHNDDYLGVKVEPGYSAKIYVDRSAGGLSLEVTGNVKNFFRTFHSDRRNWDWGDEISSVRITRLPYSYKDEAKKMKEGIYYLYNPYKNTYIRSGKGAGTKAEVETENQNFRLNRNNRPGNDDSYKFVVVRGSGDRFYIFNLASGKALIPKNSDNFEIGAEATSISFSDGMQNQKLRKAAYQLKPHGLNRFSIVCDWNDGIALTMADTPWDAEPLTYEVYKKESAQQFEFMLVKAFDSKKSFSPEKIKNQMPPSKSDYANLEYFNNKTTPHKIFATKIPFYMVKDERYQNLEQRMQSSPFYTLVREEFVQRKGGDGDGWFYNKTSSEANQTYTFSTTNTSGSSNENSSDIGLSQSIRIMVSDGFFSEVETTTTFSTNLGFTQTEYNEYSKNESRSIVLPTPPCSKGATFGIGNRITLKRHDGSVVKSYEVYSKQSLNPIAIPLHPDGCPTLRAKGQEAYDNALRAYNNYYNNPQGGSAGN